MLNYDNKYFDKTIFTADNYAEFSFNICVCMRVLIGILMISNIVGKWFIIALCSIILYFFIGKAKKVGNTNWKYYNKTVIAYSAMMLTQFIPDKSGLVGRSAGFIMILESMLGLQTRDIYNKLS